MPLLQQTVHSRSNSGANCFDSVSVNGQRILVSNFKADYVNNTLVDLCLQQRDRLLRFAVSRFTDPERTRRVLPRSIHQQSEWKSILDLYSFNKTYIFRLSLRMDRNWPSMICRRSTEWSLGSLNRLWKLDFMWIAFAGNQVVLFSPLVTRAR